MQWFLVVTIISTSSTLIGGHPHHEVEIEKQRLVKFPEESFHYQTREQSDETKRILEEINKINVALGYVRKHEHRTPAILDSSTYLYPQQSYHPSHNHFASGSALPSSIQTSDNGHPFVSRKITHHHSVMIPQILDAPTFHYPAPYLRLPLGEEPENFRTSPENLKGINSDPGSQNLMAISNDVTSIIEYAHNSRSNEEGHYHVEEQSFNSKLLGDLKRMIAEEAQIKKAKAKIESLRKDENIKKALPEYILLPSKHLSNTHEHNTNHTSTKPLKSERKPSETKIQILPTKTPAPLPAERGPVGLFRPRPTKPPTPTNVSTTMQTTKMPLKKVVESNESEEDEEHGTEKYFLSGLSGVNKEALREGGIIIQRLRVRKGGIAIAGPGGVATAGSGGTAIVGPGGLALTHPKSLTIAGPGARVVALPETFDLDRAVLKSSLRHLPEEGRVVATGPTIYYHHPEHEFSLPDNLKD